MTQTAREPRPDGVRVGCAGGADRRDRHRVAPRHARSGQSSVRSLSRSRTRRAPTRARRAGGWLGCGVSRDRSRTLASTVGVLWPVYRNCVPTALRCTRASNRTSGFGAGPHHNNEQGCVGSLPEAQSLTSKAVPHVCAVCLLCGGHARQTVCGASLVWLASQASSGAAREKVMLAVSITYSGALRSEQPNAAGAVAAILLVGGSLRIWIGLPL